MTSLSTKQHATLRYLREKQRTVAEISAAVGVGKGCGAMLRSLHQQGFIAYVGGPGIKVGRGWWRLTERGRAVALEEA